MNSLANKSVLITGASRGIGEATARHFAEAGALVVLAARSRGDIDRIAHEIKADGGEALAIACDVASCDDVVSTVRQTVDWAGSLDVLVNNAGLVEPISKLSESDPAEWSKVLDVNLKGVYFGLRAASEIMIRQGGGTVINISSGAASSPLDGWSHYCASKAGALMLTRCAHQELGDQGIRVIGLSPGTVATDMQVKIKASGINPVSRLDPSVHIPPAWVAKTIAYLCGPGGDDYCGMDFSLKTEEGRRACGLPPTRT